MKKLFTFTICAILIPVLLSACLRNNGDENDTDSGSDVTNNYANNNNDDNNLIGQNQGQGTNNNVTDEIATRPPLALPSPNNVAPGPFPFSFETIGHNREVFNSADLGERDLFFIYLWATWCQACMEGLRRFAELEEQFEGRVGFLGLLIDMDGGWRTAHLHKGFIGVDFISVYSELPELTVLRNMARSQFVPTSIIIDRYGNMVGEQIIGAVNSGHIESAINALEARHLQ
ncbi:MAG: thioredoxin family protein [Defluviitaleaceae bacterium]|nr:thioredoxin family protein [Defluviitaleaceae bacterium]